MKYLADIQLGRFTGFGPLGNPPGTGIEVFSKFISTVVGLMTVIAVIWFIFVFITGVIGIIGSGGDKAAFESARKRITSGIIGLIAVIAAIFIIDLVGGLIGIPNILDLPALFNQIQ